MGLLPVWIESGSDTYTGNPFMKKSVGHIRAFTKISLERLLEAVGFSDVRIEGAPILGNGSYSPSKERI